MEENTAMNRHERREEERDELKELKQQEQRAWYRTGRVWLWIGVTVCVALLLYWIIFIGIWDGPNQ